MAPNELPPSGHGRQRGLVSTPSRDGVWAGQFAPPEALADVVESFWYGRWDLPVDAPHVTELLGDPCVHLVAERGSARVVGVWTRRWVRALEGQGMVRAVKLRAGAVRAFLDIEAKALSDRITPLEEATDLSAAAFETALLEPEEHETAFAALAEILVALRRDEERAEVARAVRTAALLRERELHRVEALAERAGLGVRALQRMFRRHVGASPKRLLRRVRLQEAALRIERGEPTSLAGLAADLGYADQAHFTRDFKTAVGKTPRALAAALKA